MDDFLLSFFPSVYEKKHRAKQNNYCKYDNPYLQLFTSSLYLAAIVASFFASLFCRKFGRKPTMQAASVFFLVGAILNCVAQNLGMLIAGRLLLGAGVGFGNQVSFRSPNSAKNIFLRPFNSHGMVVVNVCSGSPIIYIRNCATKIQRRTEYLLSIANHNWHSSCKSN